MEIIDERRSDTYLIEMLSKLTSYDDASPPVIIQGPKNLTVTPGSQYQLECKAEGAPTPKLTITRREEASMARVRSKNSDRTVQLSATHVIHKNERVQQSDEGWYRCVAANSRGVVYADTYLRVYDLCADITCTGGKVCVPDNEAATASCICPECIDSSYNPLCGTDCVTHFNYCQLQHKNCLYGTSYTRFLDGKFCPQFDPPVFVETPERWIDVVDGKTFTLTCRADPSGGSPGPPPIIAWYGVDYEAPTIDGENPTLMEPDYGMKLGDGEVLKYRTSEGMDIFCVAHQCKHGQSIPIDVVSEQISIGVSPGEINVWNGGPSCQIFGDPHILTFDGTFYDFEGNCEYVLAMDCVDRSWVIYGSFETCSTHGRGSCLSSVTLHYNDEISLDLLRGRVVNVAGERIEVDISHTLTGKKGSQLYLSKQDGWLVVKFGVDFMANTHYELRWDGLMSTQILLSNTAPPTCGLCGDGNGDPADDLRMRWTGDVAPDVRKFGDSWKIDRRNKCAKTADMEEWEWEKEFADRKEAAVRACNKMFAAQQLLDCANGASYGPAVAPGPYKEACIADYMRSDFFPEDIPGANAACVAVMNYSERCGNVNNQNHLWREQSGCAGETEELQEFEEFVGQFGCDF